MKYIVFAFLLIISTNIYAQNTFEKTFYFGAEETATDAIEVTNGYIISTIQDDCGLCGASQGLIKLNEFGDTIWTKHYSHGTAYESSGPIVNFNNGFVLADNFTSFNSFVTNEAISLNMLDSNGNLIWQTIIEDTLADLIITNVFVDPSNNIIAGYNNTRDGGIHAVSIDSNGNVLWNKKLGNSPVYFRIHDMIVNSSFNYFIMGIGALNNIPHTFLLKVDTHGDTLWSRYYPVPVDSIDGLVLVLTDNNEIVIAGSALDSLNQPQFNLIKLDDQGNILWRNTLNSTDRNHITSITNTFDKGFAISGKKLDGTAEVRLVLMKADSTGEKVWERIFCLPNCYSSNPNSILETRDSMLLISGQIQIIPTIPQIYVVKTDSLGNVVTEIGDFQQPEYYFRIYPNPGNGVYYISNSGYDLSGFIFNSVGELLKTVTNEYSFDLSDFSDGLYFYRFLDSENRLFRGKIIQLKN